MAKQYEVLVEYRCTNCGYTAHRAVKHDKPANCPICFKDMLVPLEEQKK